MAAKNKPPWERSAPKKKRATKSLSAARKTAAKRRAKKAGRPYPNLVDNMREAAKSPKKTTKKQRSTSPTRKKR